MLTPPKPPLVYSTSALALYGTERVTIDTLEAFSAERTVIMVAPPGPALDLAQERGITTYTCGSLIAKWWILFQLSWKFPSMRLMALSVVDSYLYLSVRLLQLRSPRHLHVIHGSGSPETSYISKRFLKHIPIDVVAVSQYAKETLCHYSGLNASKVGVIENFVRNGFDSSIQQRKSYQQGESLKNVVVISRLERPKRVDLVLESIEQFPSAWKGMSIHIYGDGYELETLKSRALALSGSEVEIVFHGFQSDVTSRIQNFDLLLHLCPVEPFGIVYLEAMASRVLVLGPDRGSGVIEAGKTGFVFGADNPDSLAKTIERVRGLDSESIRRVVDSAYAELKGRFSSTRALNEYRSALEGLIPNTKVSTDR